MDNIYLTLERGSVGGDTTAAIKIFVKPLIVWLWIGGAMMVVGTALSGFPGQRRRRPTDPTSAPVELGDAPAGRPPASATIDVADDIAEEPAHV